MIRRLPALFGVPVLAVATRMLIAGPIAPPAGPVGGSYKTLAEIEPRVVLSQTNTPGDAGTVFIISAPGSYILDGNVQISSGKSAIRLDSDDVTIDLRGFAIDGSTSPAATSFGSGIFTTAPRRNISVRNGTIRGMGGYGITGAVLLANFDNLALIDNKLGQLEVFGADDSIARNLRISTSGGEADLTLGENATVESCTIEGGFLGIQVTSGVISRCTVRNTVGVGIRTGSATVSDCYVSGVSSAGSFSNGGIVTSSGARVERCAVRQCIAPGIFIGGDSTIAGCTVSSCAIGLRETIFLSGHAHIEGNTFLQCTLAISLDTAHQLVIGNRFSGNATNITAAPGCAIGEFVDISAGGTLAGASVHPASNINY